MNKQIEERLELSDIIDYAMRDWDDYIDECQEEGIPPIDTFEEYIADAVLDAGYRKQTEGEWLHPLYDKPWQPGTFGRCSKCNEVESGHTKKMPNYCSNCGAKMKPVYLQL